MPARMRDPPLLVSRSARPLGFCHQSSEASTTFPRATCYILRTAPFVNRTPQHRQPAHLAVVEVFNVSSGDVAGFGILGRPRRSIAVAVPLGTGHGSLDSVVRSGLRMGIHNIGTGSICLLRRTKLFRPLETRLGGGRSKGEMPEKKSTSATGMDSFRSGIVLSGSPSALGLTSLRPPPASLATTSASLATSPPFPHSLPMLPAILAMASVTCIGYHYQQHAVAFDTGKGFECSGHSSSTGFRRHAESLPAAGRRCLCG